MSRIYENLFSTIDFKSFNNTVLNELSENCSFLKRCCCEISSFASDYNYKDIPANGYLSLLAVIVNFDKVLSTELRKQQPRFKKFVSIARCLRIMFEILMEFKETMDEREASKGQLLASDYNVGFKGFTYTQNHPKDLSVIFGTIGPFWLYKSIQKLVRQLGVGIALLHPFPKSLYLVRSKKSRSITLAKSAISAKTFKLLDLCDSKMYSLYVKYQHRRSSIKAVTKIIDVDTIFEICKEAPFLKQSKSKNRVRFRYLFNTEKLDERKDLLIHIHGGCFIKSSPDAHEIYLKNWALKLTNVPIVAVDYSKSKFPAGLQDVVDLYLWITSDTDVYSVLGFKPNRILLSGDSAGANMAVSLSLVLNDISKSYPSKSIKFPSGILSVYGAFKIMPVMSPSRLLAGIDPMLYQTLMLTSLYYYSGADEHDNLNGKNSKQKIWFQRDEESVKEVFNRIANVLKHPFASPIHYSFNEMIEIPLSLIACHYCPLLDDSIELANLWTGAVELHVFDGLPHGFLNFLSVSNEARDASDKCVEILKQFLLNNNE